METRFDKSPIGSKFKLVKTDWGVDGYDATREIVAYFTTEQKALAWLSKRDYTYMETYGEYAHKDKARRHCMGKITFRVVPLIPVPELDPE